MDIKVTEYFSDTKETIEREPTANEIAAFEARAVKYEALEIAKEVRTTQRQAILDRLGLTSEEARLLLS